MAFPFKIGDTVYMKSGGHGMTVENFSEVLGTVDVVWFDAHDVLHRASLSIDTVELDSDDEGVDPEDVE
jgi:uncharacterized protein YodC (DUF2158 family)